MRARHIISTIDTHTHGEPTRIITSGLPPLPGDTVLEKRRYFQTHFDRLRLAMVREPRGHRDMFAALLTVPISPGAAFSVIFMDNAGYLTGCGHATIGIGTALVEAGIIPAQEPVTRFGLDTATGRVELAVAVKDGRVSEAGFRNVPAFALGIGVPLEVDGMGRLEADIAFGGNVFAIVDAQHVGIDVRPEHGSRIASLGMAIMRAAHEQLSVGHPAIREIDRVQIVTFLAPPESPSASYRSTHVFGHGQLDRSPGGTGTSAVMAAMHARGRLPIGGEVVAEGLVGGVFRGRLVGEDRIGDQPAVIPEVHGRAFITGLHTFVVDPDDPLAEGFVVS